MTVAEIMRQEGYEAASTGGGCWTWARPTDDGSVLWICTYDNALEGDPLAVEWYIGRHSDVDAGFVQCFDLFTLAHALALAPRLGSPKALGAELQVTMHRSQLLEDGA
jgi:hypothetical protein